MNGAEFTCVRESLGLTLRWMAIWLSVSERKVTRWEDGKEPVPASVAALMEDLELEAIELCRDMIAEPLALERGHTWITYRTDADAREGGIRCAPDAVSYGRGIRYPASWHRAIVSRCRYEIGGDVAFYVPVDDRT